jgi:hypothetical protein
VSIHAAVAPVDRNQVTQNANRVTTAELLPAVVRESSLFLDFVHQKNGLHPLFHYTEQSVPNFHPACHAK